MCSLLSVENVFLMLFVFAPLENVPSTVRFILKALSISLSYIKRRGDDSQGKNELVLSIDFWFKSDFKLDGNIVLRL